MIVLTCMNSSKGNYSKCWGNHCIVSFFVVYVKGEGICKEDSEQWVICSRFLTFNSSILWIIEMRHKTMGEANNGKHGKRSSQSIKKGRKNFPFWSMVSFGVGPLTGSFLSSNTSVCFISKLLNWQSESSYQGVNWPGRRSNTEQEM